jgi:hypothetical protein
MLLFDPSLTTTDHFEPKIPSPILERILSAKIQGRSREKLLAEQQMKLLTS